ncbi:hypothetical protein CDD81_2540 [Ophiocordyceps australis]|uniref:Peptidase A1 domain-containing protein n=1 Tax=Ophiocordyceps australis TaxID=1399860 RepID=A0A2C5YCK0_9HYPO|nr:hypothetical protein CDD81_2540 [Ophiocordyceps australis]
MRAFSLVPCAVAWSLSLLLAARADSGWDISKPLNGITFERAKAVQSGPTPDGPAPRFSRLRNIKGRPSTHSAVSALGRVLRGQGGVGHEPVWQNISKAGDFTTHSDTWAVQKGFRCDDGYGTENSEAACGFGKPLIDKFGKGSIEDLHFFLKYGSGERVVGPMGRSEISCGGVTVPEQQVGLANYTYWHGNNMTVGVLGLAYQSLTSAFYGDVGTEAPWNAMSYSPFLTNAITQGSMDPVFSVALVKNSSEGILAWGGLPPMAMAPRSRSVSAATDLIIANLVGQAEASWRYSFYTIVPDGIQWGQTKDSTKYPYIVDTGTTMNYLPPPLAEAVAMAFEPRAVYMYQWGSYFAPCDAIPPRFAVIISGVEFWINPADLLYQDLRDPLTGYCAVAISSGGSGPYILGDVFLQNVVAVFDVGGAQMRFYSRH